MELRIGVLERREAVEMNRCSDMAPTTFASDRERKLARIEELVRAEEREGLGLVRYMDTEHTCGEHSRRRMRALLDSDPNWEPPKRWYSNSFGMKYGLPTD